MKRILFVAAAAVLSGACYQATVTTGRPASDEHVKVPWASSWVDGLVPPKVVDVASRCPNGVAQVQTMHSFPNMLVGALTFGIYTPMTIDVTCAASRSASSGAPAVKVEGATHADLARAVTSAAQQSEAAGGAPVLVDFSSAP